MEKRGGVGKREARVEAQGSALLKRSSRKIVLVVVLVLVIEPAPISPKIEDEDEKENEDDFQMIQPRLTNRPPNYRCNREPGGV
jgi:hypothetical protein